MFLWHGEVYNDDRIFILDLQETKKKNIFIWAVVTRRNCTGFRPFKVNEFHSKKEAIEFIVSIEPSTPLISLSGKSPQTPLGYEAYCAELKKQGLSSALEIYGLNKNHGGELILEEEESKDVFMGNNETELAFVPKRLEIVERPELNVFPFNVVFASLKSLSVAMYLPEFSTFEETDSSRKLRYYNTASRSWWLEIEYSKERENYMGFRFCEGESRGGAFGAHWGWFFSHLTMEGVLENEPVDPEQTALFANALKEYV